MAMSARFQEGNLIVLDDFSMDRIKTKDFVGIMETLNVGTGLVIVDMPSDTLLKSSRNSNGFMVLPVEGVNVYDILLHEKLVLVKPAIDILEKRLTA